MTDEEMAEEYCNNEMPFDVTESGEKLYTKNDLKYAYLAALKTGSQLDKVWHDYDAGEDCYEDTHEGRWIEREVTGPKWHDLRKDPNDLPVRRCIDNDGNVVRLFHNSWDKKLTWYRYDFHECEWWQMETEPIAWCEIPEYTEE